MNDLDEINELLLEHNCVKSIFIEFEEQEMQYSLVLTMADSELLGSKKIRYVFDDIASLGVQKFGGGLNQFMHLKISKIDCGYDKAKYELRDEEGGGVYFTFSSLSKS
ncbi:hypothetical protein [Pseudomonas tolaasii]|uniref:hypothetical protein n=1 Tax=Pseudomonas tolaasii TaxID=29442 RepID=UPI00036EEC97|nr:hypothetical protein [Pseudomonas tolaasii]